MKKTEILWAYDIFFFYFVYLCGRSTHMNTLCPDKTLSHRLKFPQLTFKMYNCKKNVWTSYIAYYIELILLDGNGIRLWENIGTKKGQSCMQVTYFFYLDFDVAIILIPWENSYWKMTRLIHCDGFDMQMRITVLKDWCIKSHSFRIIYFSMDFNFK